MRRTLTTIATFFLAACAYGQSEFTPSTSNMGVTDGVTHPANVSNKLSIGGTDSDAPFYFDPATGMFTINTVGGGISVAPSLTSGSSLVLDEALDESSDYDAGAGTGTPNTFTLKVNDAGLASDLTCTVDSGGVWSGDCPGGGGPLESWFAEISVRLQGSEDCSSDSDYLCTTEVFHRGTTTGITHNRNQAANDIVLGTGTYRITLSNYWTGGTAAEEDKCKIFVYAEDGGSSRELYLMNADSSSYSDAGLNSSALSQATRIYKVSDSSDDITVWAGAANCPAPLNSDVQIFILIERMI